VQPVIYAITDRHRLPMARDAAADGVLLDALVAHVSALADAGVHLVQIRERDLAGRTLFDLASRCVAAVRGTSTRIIVNDRLDVALAARAHGVHLRGDSFGAACARLNVPRGFLIGRSVHQPDEAHRVASDDRLDYLLFAPVYETPSKPGQPAAGLEGLRATTSATTIPVLALGGMTVNRMPPIRDAGAQGFAAIGFFACEAGELRRRVFEAGEAFDTLQDRT
jgi:thiamine-phosphate pyrophosphorylase